MFFSFFTWHLPGRAWSVHGKGPMHANVAFPNPNFSSLSLSYSQDHQLLITQFLNVCASWHHVSAHHYSYLEPTIRHCSYLVFKWLWSSFCLVLPILGIHACPPSRLTGNLAPVLISGGLGYHSLLPELMWYLCLHTTSRQSVPKILVTVKQSTPLVLGWRLLLSLSKMKLASVCRLLWSLLSFQLPFFSSASLLQRAHKGSSCHLNLAGMFLPGGWLTFSPGVLKWKSFLIILYLELNPFLPCSSGMFYFSPGNLTLSMTMCVFSSYFLYGLTHPTSCKSLEQGFCLMNCASNHLLHRKMTEWEFVGSVSYCNPWSVHQDVWWSVSYIYETPLGTP